jgi:tetratricopeptide (TPR) repeat protein
VLSVVIFFVIITSNLDQEAAMPEEKITIEEAHRRFAKICNAKAWELLGKSPRTPADNEELLLAAQASLYHWQQVGTALNTQRGHWLLAHAYAVLHEPSGAMKHATRCIELTKTHMSEMKDFDIAYAFEAMARTYALLGDMMNAKEYYDMALRVGQAIQDPEDKQIFLGDFSQGEWFGVI